MDDWKDKGGCSVGMYGVSGIERIRGRGVGSPQVGVGYGWVTPTPMFKHPPALPLLVSLRVNALRLRLALMPWLALIASYALTVLASIDLR